MSLTLVSLHYCVKNIPSHTSISNLVSTISMYLCEHPYSEPPPFSDLHFCTKLLFSQDYGGALLHSCFPPNYAPLSGL